MAGRQPFHLPRITASVTATSARSLPAIIAFSSLLLLVLFLYFTSSSSSPPQLHSPDPDYSFVTSLDKFLKVTHNDRLSISFQSSITQLDDAISRTESQRLYHTSSPSFPLRVYVYQMPPKFTYDLLHLFINTYRDTSNLTSNGSPVHRLIEQHSVDYWLWADLISQPESERKLTDVVVRVLKQEDADLFYIPFFTTISFFLLEKQQCKALYRV